MSSTFFGISIAQSGLSAQSRAMEVLGYNIAHANDPNYDRQITVPVEGEVLAQSQEASSTNVLAYGSGAQSGDVQRVRDALIEIGLRTATQSSGNWDYLSNTMDQLQTIISEPSDNSLLTSIDSFWNSWQQVATTPNDESLRNTLMENAKSMCQQMQYTYQQIGDLGNSLNQSVTNDVTQINTIASQIGQLNNQIGALEKGQMPVNDLLDSRDGLLKQLSQLTQCSVHGDDGNNGNLIVSIGGRVLVQGTLVHKLTTTQDSKGNAQIEWAADSESPESPVTISNGQLNAELNLRDNIIPDYLSQLDDIATSMRDAVNAQHSQGQTMDGAAGGDFFQAGTTAADLSLDPTIDGNPRMIAASSTGADSGKGNGTNAQAIAAIQKAVMGGGLTVDQMYQALIGDIGTTASTAKSQSSAHDLSTQQFTTQQQSVSGVSLDEEMTNMIKFQQAYNAASRVLTSMNDMLSVLMQTASGG